MKLGREYIPLIIKRYYFWTLVLHGQRQVPYLGRCYAWWKDEYGNGECKTPADIPHHAIVEAQVTVFNDVLRACAALGYSTEPYGKQFLLNMAYLSNEEGRGHHLHWHYVPRFRQPMHFSPFNLGVEDTQWGKVFLPGDRQRGLEPEQLKVIRDIMANATG